MAMFRLPVDKFELPYYTFNITLDGVRYALTMRYNSREDRWHLDFADAQGTPILTGTPLLIYRALIYAYATLDLPDGDMLVTDDSGQMLQPTIQSFLNDHSLIYETVE